MRPIEEYEKKIGYTFQNKQLLETALTHSSYANEHKCGSYERLESGMFHTSAARVLVSWPSGRSVHLNSNVIGKGGGRSKKEAEQQAAREALELMGY